MQERISDLWLQVMGNPVLAFLAVKILIPLLIIAAGMIVIKVLVGATEKSMQKAGLDELIRHFLIKLIKMGCIVLIAMTVLALLGVPTTSFVAVIGSVGVAMALACKDALTNFVGGVTLLFNHPFCKGDYIDDLQVKGTVEKVDLFYSILRAEDGCRIIVPNGRLVNTTIINHGAKVEE